MPVSVCLSVCFCFEGGGDVDSSGQPRVGSQPGVSVHSGKTGDVWYMGDMTITEDEEKWRLRQGGNSDPMKFPLIVTIVIV